MGSAAFMVGQCPDSEVRQASRNGLKANFGIKGTLGLIELLVWLWFRSSLLI
jgi:hypothetical protein